MRNDHEPIHPATVGQCDRAQLPSANVALTQQHQANSMANGRNKLRKDDSGRDSRGFIALFWSVLDCPACNMDTLLALDSENRLTSALTS
jgi:hypothetical protein